MFGIGGVEFILILLFVFIIFGADRLPEIARVLGKAIAKFRKAQAEMNAAIQSDVKNLETDEQPFQKSVEAFDKFGKEAVAAAKETVTGVQKSNEVKYGKAGTVAAATAAGAAAQAAAPQAEAGGEEKKPAKPIAAKVTGSTGTPLVASSTTANANVAPTAATAPRRESFTERKARYEAERAARAAAEAAKAAEAAPAPAPAADAAPAPAPSGEGE